MKNNRPLYYAAIGIVAAALFAASSFMGGAQNGGNTARHAGDALTENDFVKDPSLFAVPEAGVVATFLENPNSTFEPDDTGAIGMDTIPFKYANGMNQTFCWQDDNRESRHFMTLVDSNGSEVLRVEANGDCVTQFINQGNYEMRIQHDDSGDEVFATVFSIPEVDAENSFETVLSTNKCQGCDLSGANFSNAILTETDLRGADLTGADLSDADLSGTNLSDSLLAGADLTGANLANADLSGADLTDALTANTNFTDANLTNAISFDESNLRKESTTAQEEPGAPGPEPCPSGNLRPTGGDIVIDHACNVTAGTYQYGNINVISGGTLTFNDANINFWVKSILIQNGGSMIAGSQQNPIGTNGQITIHLYGKDQGSGGKGITCKTADGQTDPMCGVDKNIWMSNEPPNPNSCKQTTDSAGVTDCFYRYHPLPVDTGDDNGYFGYKVIAVSYGGTLQLFGKKGATYPDTNPDPSKSGTSWVRLAADLKGGGTETQLTVDDHMNPVDWKKDDLIVVTTTDYLPGHSERLTIAENPTTKDDKGNTIIKVKETIQYPHNGTAYDLSSIPSRLGLDFNKAETRAAVALLTRSIRIVSGCNSDNIADCKLDCGYQDCFPVSQGFIGGHTIVRQGFKTFQVQGVEFYQLGQGGRLGHYSVHFHVARKTPKDTFVKDCSTHDSMTRWITLHATHGVLLARNVGYMSIGHGYYLEDGSEINNRLYSNLGMLARSAADNAQNPRKVPGILSSPKVCSGAQTKTCKSNADCTGMEGTCNLPPAFPFLSDWVHPTVFWFMNGWNDFEYNMAAGATACGACYWPVLGSISTASKNLKWDSYASIQKGTGRGGTAPIKKFKGNYCTTAMNSFNSTPDTALCHGVLTGSVRLNQIENPLAPAPNPDRGAETHYPTVTQTLPAYTRCDGENTDCSSVQLCAADNRNVCTVTVLDRYTSSFNWVETNFSAIWLRPRWFLVQNSVITDVQNAGVTFVTGGDYTHSSVISGNWMLARKNVFIGNTQQNNAFASNAGPFVKGGLKCENSETNYCIYRDQGITMPLSNFGMNQRFFNIYDGPSLQDSNAYLDIKKTFIDDCSFPNNNQQCNNSEWMYGRVLGVPGDATQKKGYLPNAAIAWKQNNGFYYPPAFHSKNLFFDHRQSPHGVDIRHFVIEPLFAPETATTWFKTSTDVKDHYAQWNPTMFDNFTAIDRQTILNDDDGSLTGLANTVSVNEDPFFNAPVETVECLSDGTAKTSPYEHITTVIYPGCAADGTCGADKMACTKENDCPCLRDVCDNTCDWCRNCTTTGPIPCYGVPLYRQFLTKSENEMTNPDTKIRMMGPSVFGRINLTTNHAKYYISTTDGATQQSPTPLKSIFRKGDKYYVFLVYAKPTARQTYQVYVGANANLNSDFPQNVEAVGASLATKALAFDSICTKLDSSLCEKDSTTMTDFPKNWERHYDSEKGILTVTIDLSDFKTQFDNAKQDICQPGTFCTPSGNQCQCSSSLDSELKKECDEGKICSEWAVKDIDCPVFTVGGERLSRCVGFSYTIPSDGNFVADGTDHRPKETDRCFPKNMDWNVAWNCVKEPLAGACADPNNRPIPETQFCTDNKTPICSTNIVMGTEADDMLTGTPESDIIYGLGGNDIIEGRGGTDWISGGPGDDEIRGGRGDDIIFGEEGDDFIKGGGGKDELDGGSEADIVKGGRGQDVCVEGEKVRACEQ